jgi:hypothetical protein
MNGRAAACWRSAVLGLWLVTGLLPPLAPSPREVLPPCCRDDGAHQCAMRHRNGGGKTRQPALTVSCVFNAPAKATGARLTALQPNPPGVQTRDTAARKVFALPNEAAPAAMVIRRASRAPPRRLV